MADFILARTSKTRLVFDEYSAELEFRTKKAFAEHISVRAERHEKIIIRNTLGRV